MIAVIFALGEAPCVANSGENFHYLIHEATGEIYAWSSMETGWVPVIARAKLAEGTIIQSKGGLKLVAVRVTEGSKVKGQKIVIEALGNIMFRLTPELSREFELANYFVKKSSDLELPSKGGEEDNLSLRDAWEKVLALISSKQAQKKGGDNLKFGKGKSQEVRTEVEGTVLTISYPAKGGVFVPENFPLEVPVIWNEPVTKPDKGNVWVFDVFFKSTADSEYRRIGNTTKPSYTLPILKEGSFSVMIRAANGNARSEETLFSVFPADAEVWKKVPKKKESPSQKPTEGSKVPSTVH